MAPLDTGRYRLDPPSQARRNDVSAWSASLDNAHAQLEHQATRIQNLELLLKFGDKVRSFDVQRGAAVQLWWCGVVPDDRAYIVVVCKVKETAQACWRCFMSCCPVIQLLQHVALGSRGLQQGQDRTGHCKLAVTALPNYCCFVSAPPSVHGTAL
jgi:hypothetical protein